MNIENCPVIVKRIDDLLTLANMIENEGNCDIRKILKQSAVYMIREIAAYYNPPDDVTPEEVETETVYTPTDKGKEELREEPPKRKRGRRKKDEVQETTPESVEPEPSAPVEPEPLPSLPSVPVESEDSPLDPEPVQRSRSLVFDSGCLDKRFPRVQDIMDITDEFLSTANVSPVVLANSCATRGEHPFYKGPASFIWYLDEERRRFYMAGLFDDEKFYPELTDLIDAARLKEADVVGPDMTFVASVIDTDTLLPVEPVIVEDDPEAVNRLRAGGMKRILDDLKEAGVEEEQAKTVARFMTRFGIDAQVEEDLGTVAALHLDPMEKNPDVRF